MKSDLTIDAPWAWWYTIKSVGLAGALATLAYMIGRDHGRKEKKR